MKLSFKPIERRLLYRQKGFWHYNARGTALVANDATAAADAGEGGGLAATAAKELLRAAAPPLPPPHPASMFISRQDGVEAGCAWQ